MVKRLSNIRIVVSPTVCLSLVFTMLFLPLPWAVSWLFSAVIHELGHYLVSVLCNHRVNNIYIGAIGAIMYAETMASIETLCCSLAGPAAAGILILLYKLFPRLAVCALVQTTYNLLPMKQLDGGRAIKALLEMMINIDTVEKICSGLELIVITVMLICCICAIILLHMGLIPVLLFLGFVFRHKKIKIPCKAWAHRVQ